MASTRAASPPASCARGITNSRTRKMGRERERLETLEVMLAALNRHDLDAIMDHVAEDWVFESPRGPDPLGAAFREGRGSARAGGETRRHPRCALRRRRSLCLRQPG